MTISDEAVEAAAEAIMHAAFGQELPEAPDDLARAAIEAAAPFIRAGALEEAAERFDTRSETLLRTMQNMAGHPDTSADDVVRYGAYSAEANTTAHWLRARSERIKSGIHTA